MPTKSQFTSEPNTGVLPAPVSSWLGGMPVQVNWAFLLLSIFAHSTPRLVRFEKRCSYPTPHILAPVWPTPMAPVMSGALAQKPLMAPRPTGTERATANCLAWTSPGPLHSVGKLARFAAPAAKFPVVAALYGSRAHLYVSR